MRKIRIVRLDVKKETLLEKCAALYCGIWREPPWNEDFWTQEAVIKDIKEQMRRPSSLGFIAVWRREPYNYERMDICGAKAAGWLEADLLEPIGFTWGYEVNIADLSEISGASQSKWRKLVDKRRVFYIDELGVDAGYRKQGAGQKITRRLLKQATNMGIIYVTLRTDMEAVAARSLYKKLGFKELSISDKKYPGRSYWMLNLNPFVREN